MKCLNFLRSFLFLDFILGQILKSQYLLKCVLNLFVLCELQCTFVQCIDEFELVRIFPGKHRCFFHWLDTNYSIVY